MRCASTQWALSMASGGVNITHDTLGYGTFAPSWVVLPEAILSNLLETETVVEADIAFVRR